MEQLEAGLKQTQVSFQALDAKLTAVGQASTKIGDRLHSSDLFRRRAYEAIDMIQFLQEFSMVEDLSELSNIFQDDQQLAQAAVLLLSTPPLPSATSHQAGCCFACASAWQALWSQWFRSGKPNGLCAWLFAGADPADAGVDVRADQRQPAGQRDRGWGQAQSVWHPAAGACPAMNLMAISCMRAVQTGSSGCCSHSSCGPLAVHTMMGGAPTEGCGCRAP